MRRSWWQVNRWWLVAVPLALVVALAGSAYRVKHFWWEGGPHRLVGSATAGHYAHATEGYEDGVGRTTRTFAVRLTSITPVDAIPGFDERPVPKGSAAFRLRLDWRATPDQALGGCEVRVVDTRGRRYEMDVVPSFGNVHSCVPDGHEGPSEAQKGDERGVVEKGHARPAAWHTDPVVVTYAGARIASVEISWTYPDFVRLAAPRG